MDALQCQENWYLGTQVDKNAAAKYARLHWRQGSFRVQHRVCSFERHLALAWRRLTDVVSFSRATSID